MPLALRASAQLGLAVVATAVAPLTTASAVADPSPLSTLVSTAAGSGAARVDATCHFGPVHPDNFEDQMIITGVATAPGAVATTVRCTLENDRSDGGGVEATAEGSLATAVDNVPHWRSAIRVCVSAAGDFGDTLGVVVAPKVCQ